MKWPWLCGVAKDGQLVPEVVQVISIVAKNNLVLETGHSSPAEALLLTREARRSGLHRCRLSEFLTVSALLCQKRPGGLESTWTCSRHVGHDAAGQPKTSIGGADFNHSERYRPENDNGRSGEEP